MFESENVFEIMLPILILFSMACSEGFSVFSLLSLARFPFTPSLGIVVAVIFH